VKLYWKQTNVAARIVIALFVTVLQFAQAHASATNAANGSITVDGKKTEFRHAYAVTQPSLGSSAKPETVLVITDKPLSAATAADRGERQKARERDGVRMLVVSADTRPDDVVSIFISVPPMNTTDSTRRFKLAFDPVGDKRLKGRLSMDEPWESFGIKYRIDVSFDANLLIGK
jgi:hypothetical protein